MRLIIKEIGDLSSEQVIWQLQTSAILTDKAMLNFLILTITGSMEKTKKAILFLVDQKMEVILEWKNMKCSRSSIDQTVYYL